MMDLYLTAGLLALLGLAFFVARHFRRASASRPLPDQGATTIRREKGGKPAFHEAETRFVELPRSKPYQLLNTAEQALYHRLVEAMPNMIVCPQISMALLAQLRGRQALAEARAMLGRSVDFLICREDFSIIAAIELTWPTPEDLQRQQTEMAKQAALEKLGIPLIVFRPNELPDADAISREIATAIIRRKQLEERRNPM